MCGVGYGRIANGIEYSFMLHVWKARASLVELKSFGSSSKKLTQNDYLCDAVVIGR
jgi:hypothetical protein